MTKRNRPYFSLLVQDPESNRWGVEFGAYHRAIVADEAEYLRDGGTRRANMRIIRTESDRQAAVDSVLAELNESAALAARASFRVVGNVGSCGEHIQAGA